MVNETTANGFENLLRDVCLKTNVEGMNDSVLKIALQHYLRSEWSQASHKDRHTDHSDCLCVIGGL